MEEKLVFTVTENGLGKITSLENYTLMNRGGGGYTGIELNDDDKVVCIKRVYSRFCFR